MLCDIDIVYNILICGFYQVKCSQYWPENVGTTEQFANISVTLTKCVTHADYCIRHFEIQAVSTQLPYKE